MTSSLYCHFPCNPQYSSTLPLLLNFHTFALTKVTFLSLRWSMISNENSQISLFLKVKRTHPFSEQLLGDRKTVCLSGTGHVSGPHSKHRACYACNSHRWIGSWHYHLCFTDEETEVPWNQWTFSRLFNCHNYPLSAYSYRTLLWKLSHSYSHRELLKESSAPSQPSNVCRVKALWWVNQREPMTPLSLPILSWIISFFL